MTENLAGVVLGRYHLIAHIGEGAMGAVYRGISLETDEEVALKIMASSVSEDPVYVARFEREVRTIAVLQHPNIVPFYDSGTAHGVNYVVMRLLTGGTLKERMQAILDQGKQLPDVEDVVRLVEQIASALDYAHASGVIHRDVKPSNIVFDEQGVAYLVDFGVVKIAEATSQLTGSDIVVGTPTYMAPEQWRGEDIQPASDQYALAAAAYYALTGNAPFDAPTLTEMMIKHTQMIPPAPHDLRPDLDPMLEEVFLRALAKLPQDRYPTSGDFAAALESAALHGAATQANAAAPQPHFINITSVTRKDNMTYNSAPLNDDEKLRNTLRVLFSADSTPLKRQVAHKHLTRTDDPTLGNVLLQDLIRGGFAELVLRYALGDALDALLVQVRTGDVADAQRLLAQTPVDADALADFLAQDLRSLVSNSRVDLQKQAQGTTAATEGLVSGAGGGTVADMVATIFGGEGDTRTDGLTYLKELNSPAAVEPLAAIAEDINRPAVDVLDAIEVLAAYADPAALPALRRVSRGHGEPTVRGAAVVAVVGITGRFDAIEGVVRPWAEQNPRVAEQTLLHFGDETDNDVLLMTMVRRDEPERRRIVAAAALGMSGNTDYALPVADFLHRDGKDALRERWRAMRAVERENPTPLITDMLADGLRERVQQTTLKPATNEDIEQMTPLLWAMVRFGNDRAEQALGGITSNPRVDERVRAAAERALNKLRDRRSE